MTRVLRRVVDSLLVVSGIGLLSLVVLVGAGALSWVVTTGDSMQPRFTAGDVVVTRPTGEYRIGDVVAYDSPDLGRVVLHRIVDVEDGRFVTQGDDNDWVDSYRPAPAEVTGRELVHLPGLGRLARPLFDPVVAAVVVGAAAVAALGGPRREEPCDHDEDALVSQ